MTFNQKKLAKNEKWMMKAETFENKTMFSIVTLKS